MTIKTAAIIGLAANLVLFIGLNIAQVEWGMESRAKASQALQDATDALQRCGGTLRQQHESLRACGDQLRRIHAVVGSARTIARIPYDKKANNCYDHSKALVEDLAGWGVDSYIAVTEGGRHAFVLVGMEPTPGNPNAGSFASLGAYGPITEIRDRNLNVICTKT